MGKPIDADELKERVNNWFSNIGYYHPYSKSKSIPVSELFDIIERMPIADVAERKTIEQPSRIEQELHGKTAEEQLDFLKWFMYEYPRWFTQSKIALIDWLKGEDK